MKNNDKLKIESPNKITRKEAIKKAGKSITALTAASLFFLETKAQATNSTPPGGGTGW